VRKGQLTRQVILQRAVQLSSKVGLEGLTIGTLAEDLELSKSGLFAHFQSKEALQLRTLEFAAVSFVDLVIRPALAAPRGIPRVQALFESWLDWPRRDPLQGGCFFVAAASELDDRPGPLRDRLVGMQKDWLELIATTVRTAVLEGDLLESLEPEQFAHDLYGIMLGYHHASRLLSDPEAEHRARKAFDRLLTHARRPVAN
jgi:AcrR family transcriptional regulator